MPKQSGGGNANSKPTCFIAMPITTTEDHAATYRDAEHWIHVMDELFVPAIEAAGFEPIRPVSRGSEWIHGAIIKQLVEADMVLVDLSSHNPNVFFELGVRTSVNRPVAVVRSVGTKIPFDTSGMNTPEYDPDLRPWSLPHQVELIAEHIRAAVDTCGGSNPMWRHFGLSITAEAPVADGSPADARIELLTEAVERLQREVRDGSSARLETSVPPANALVVSRKALTETVRTFATMHSLDVTLTWPTKNSMLVSFVSGSESAVQREAFRDLVRRMFAETPYTVFWGNAGDNDRDTSIRF